MVDDFLGFAQRKFRAVPSDRRLRPNSGPREPGASFVVKPLFNPCSYIIYCLFGIFCGDPGVGQSLFGPLFRLLGRLGGLLLQALVIGGRVAGGEDGHGQGWLLPKKTRLTFGRSFSCSSSSRMSLRATLVPASCRNLPGKRRKFWATLPLRDYISMP